MIPFDAQHDQFSVKFWKPKGGGNSGFMRPRCAYCERQRKAHTDGSFHWTSTSRSDLSHGSAVLSGDTASLFASCPPGCVLASYAWKAASRSPARSATSKFLCECQTRLTHRSIIRMQFCTVQGRFCRCPEIETFLFRVFWVFSRHISEMLTRRECFAFT
jgi:hypothetical protein